MPNSLSSTLAEHILVPAIALAVLILIQPLLRRILKRKPALAKLAN